jgi:hypothetical protein
MRNINHTFDVEKGDIGVTIRKGGKWYEKLGIGTEFELRVCPGPHDGVCNSLCKKVGTGETRGLWKGRLLNLPPSLLSIEHNTQARNIEVLKEMLEIGYGSISDQDIVTAVIYLRKE